MLIRLAAILFCLVLALVGCSPATAPTTAVPPTAVPTAVSEPTVEPTLEPTADPLPPTTEPEAPAPAASEDALSPETAAEIDSFLAAAYEGEPFQGAVLVARNGEVLLRKGVGMADQSASIANGPETKFRLGSLTKPFTAVAVLMLYEQGLLDIDEMICQYLVDCPPAWQAIAVHDLLAHTSGIADLTMLPDFPDFKTEPTTPLQTLARFRDLPLEFAPGERWSYSNSNYIVLSAILEQVSGQRYEAFVEEHIFAPLGMVNSGYDHNDGETATGYLPDGSAAEFIDMSLPSGAGGLYSTVDDLYRFDRALYRATAAGGVDRANVYRAGNDCTKRPELGLWLWVAHLCRSGWPASRQSCRPQRQH